MDEQAVGSDPGLEASRTAELADRVIRTFSASCTRRTRRCSLASSAFWPRGT